MSTLSPKNTEQATHGDSEPQYTAACQHAHGCQDYHMPANLVDALFLAADEEQLCAKAQDCERHMPPEPAPSENISAVSMPEDVPTPGEDVAQVSGRTKKPLPTEAFTLKGAPFKPLGYNRGECFYLPERAPQVVKLAPSQHTKNNLLFLARRSWWEKRFGGDSGHISWDLAADAMIRESQKLGIYDPSRIRGRGAWEDEGRSVLNAGDHLVADGKTTALEDFKTAYLYEADAPLELGVSASPVGTPDANKFAELCTLPSWEHPISGRLFAGWIVLSPICGALSWRPHIHVTGPSGSGKSWIMDNILRPAVGPAAVLVQSNTTEAGLRQLLKYDARPVLFDEAEAEDKSGQARMQKVLELARQASSAHGAAIVKGSSSGTAQMFKINSMFGLSSIGSAATQRADLSRITALPLKINTSFDRADQFKHIQKTAHQLLIPDFCAGLRARTVRLIPVIRKNVEVFARAASGHLGTARAGDQYGTLLAGAYSLYSAGEIDEETAVRWVQEQDWGEAVETGTDTDERRCLSVILEAVVRVDTGNRSEDVGIGEAIHSVAFGSASDSQTDSLAVALGRHGLKVDQSAGAVFVSNTHSAVARILRDTAWSVNWAQILARLPGAERVTKTVRFGGSTSKAVAIPITVIFQGECD